MAIPSVLLAPLDVDALRAAYASASPFPFVVIDGFLQPEFASAVAAAYPTPEAARASGRSFAAVNERGKSQITDPAKFPAPVRALNDLLSGSEWLELCRSVTGIPGLLADDQLVGGGIHVMRSGAHLDVHVDFNRIDERSLFRRLNILAFFNPEWSPDWGGELELWDDRVRRCSHRFAPAMNRCVLFETSEISFHGVRRVTCPAEASRKSFAAYYYTREAPAQWDGRTHTTIFRARPDEPWKKYLSMPAERIARRASRGLESAKHWLAERIKPKA